MEWPNGQVFYFTNEDVDDFDDHKVIRTDLFHTTANQRLRWEKFIEILKVEKKNLLLPNIHNVKIDIAYLPVNASILIGWLFHRNSGNNIFFESKGIRYGSSKDIKELDFKNITLKNDTNVFGMIKEHYGNVMHSERVYNLYIYIHANKNRHGTELFERYINELVLKNYKENHYSLCLMNEGSYDEGTDLLKSAAGISRLVDDIRIKLEAHGKVKLHLFYNGFSGLALLLGSQLTQTVPIHLYDYDGEMTTYEPAVCLTAKTFH